MIPKESWRIGLVYFEGYRFEPSGYIHIGCAGEYLDTVDILDRIRHFSPRLSDTDLREIEQELGG